MKLEIGKTYKDGRGNHHKIMGYTKYNEAFVWSLTAHFRQEDGRHIYDGKPQDRLSQWDIVEEVLNNDH